MIENLLGKMYIEGALMSKSRNIALNINLSVCFLQVQEGTNELIVMHKTDFTQLEINNNNLVIKNYQIIHSYIPFPSDACRCDITEK